MRILLTRPINELRATVDALARLGFEIDQVPVIEIQPLDEDARCAQLHYYLETGRPDAVLCVSRNAVLWGMPLLQELWPGAGDEARWYALGDSTAATLEVMGIEAEIPDRGSDSEAVLALDSLREIAGETVLYIAGEGGRTLIENELRTRGAIVNRWEVYRRRPDLAAGERLAGLPALPDVLTAMSGETLMALTAALPGEGARAWREVRLIVPSERVASLARQLGYARVEIAPVERKTWPADYLAAQAAL